MKSKFLALPVLALVKRVVPERQRKTALGSLFLLRILPAWSIAVAAIAFLYALSMRGSRANADIWRA